MKFVNKVTFYTQFKRMTLVWGLKRPGNGYALGSPIYIESQNGKGWKGP